MKKSIIILFLIITVFQTCMYAKSASDWLKFGSDAHLIRDLDYALNCYRKALELDDKNADAYYAIGLVLMDKGDYQTALNYLIKAYELNPEEGAYSFSVGYVYREMVNSLRKLVNSNALKLKRISKERDDAAISMYAESISAAMSAYCESDNENFYDRINRERANKKLLNDYNTKIYKIRAESTQSIQWINKFNDAAILYFQQSAKYGNKDAKEYLKNNNYSW